MTVVSQGVNHYVFDGEELIGEVFYDILIPNMRLGVVDKELFDTNHKEFIWRDLEGSDLNTNRRISHDLKKEDFTSNPACRAQKRWETP